MRRVRSPYEALVIGPPALQGLQSHGDRPSFQPSETRFDSLATRSELLHGYDLLHVLLRSRASRDGMRLRTFHHRVPRMHRPLLDVAAAARQQATPPASRCGRAGCFVLRGRHSLARVRPCELLPAVWGDSSTGELCFRTAGIGVRFPVAPPSCGTLRVPSPLRGEPPPRSRASGGASCCARVLLAGVWRFHGTSRRGGGVGGCSLAALLVASTLL